jgi:hypothetical protein
MNTARSRPSRGVIAGRGARPTLVSASGASGRRNHPPDPKEKPMTIRTLTALFALAALAPLAAHADAPAGEFPAAFHIDTSAARSAPQFPRSEHRNYVEFQIEDLVGRGATVTVEQVRAELAAMPQPVVGA